MRERYVIWFDEIGIEDVEIVGGKNASLGEMLELQYVKERSYREATLNLKKLYLIPFFFQHIFWLELSGELDPNRKKDIDIS